MNSNQMMITEKDKLSEERSIAEIMNKYTADILRSLNLKDFSESNVDDVGSNIRHSFRNFLFEKHVIVK